MTNFAEAADRLNTPPVRMKVIGVGGAGTNIAARLLLDELPQVSFAAINTDVLALNNAAIPEKLTIGRAQTRGLGTGGDVELAERAAKEEIEAIRRLVDGLDLVFLLTGLGGGVGTGVAPVVAEEAVRRGATVIVFATLPFTFEGGRRTQLAEEGLKQLRESAHAVITLPNNLLLQENSEESNVLQAFATADQWIGQGVRSIWAMLNRSGLIQVDFASLRRTLLARGGKTLFGLGVGEGPDAAKQAVDKLLACSLLHLPDSSKRADSLIVSISGGPSLTLAQVNQMMEAVSQKFGSKDNNALGAVVDENLQGKVMICVLGTTHVGTRPGLDRYPSRSQPAAHGGTVIPLEAVAPAGSALAQVLRNPKNRAIERQEQLNFGDDDEQRGYFDNTARNLYEGEDLDIPTYLRKGVRITVG